MGIVTDPIFYRRRTRPGEFILAYGLASLSGVFMGLLLGWMVWS